MIFGRLHVVNALSFYNIFNLRCVYWEVNPWTARRSNHSVLKEINPEYSLVGLMLKLNETPILWSPDAKSRLIGKDPDNGND